jgi:hypothetical protein
MLGLVVEVKVEARELGQDITVFLHVGCHNVTGVAAQTLKNP